MPKFSKTSEDRLNTCHPDLIQLFNLVVIDFDCSILCGHRGQEEQDKYFKAGISKVSWPQGKHNKTPSLAVDVAPWPIVWSDIKRFYFFAGYVKAWAESLGIKIRWGGDWDGDFMFDDQTFNDLVHFEMVSGGVE